MRKPWPILAKILIAISAYASVGAVFIGLTQRNVLSLVGGVGQLAILWGLCKRKRWALLLFNIFMALNLLSMSVQVFKDPSPLFGVVAIGVGVLILIYFNSPKIKQLFREGVIGSEGPPTP